MRRKKRRGHARSNEPNTEKRVPDSDREVSGEGPRSDQNGNPVRRRASQNQTRGPKPCPQWMRPSGACHSPPPSPRTPRTSASRARAPARQGIAREPSSDLPRDRTGRTRRRRTARPDHRTRDAAMQKVRRATGSTRTFRRQPRPRRQRRQIERTNSSARSTRNRATFQHRDDQPGSSPHVAHRVAKRSHGATARSKTRGVLSRVPDQPTSGDCMR